ncbi:hypothetical protein [Krasilnikovia sp. M28-CT-15]|uniref:hypothetical protein n=1 Tax=Krasilnikovia sp. M28-CT-15 TaxID=3373540 RepID=UPI003876AF2A
MTRTIRSRRAPARQQSPLYARMLRLKHLAPSGFLCFLFLEGSVALAILLALAELVSWWGVLVLPVAVAAMVKFNDLIAGAVSDTATAFEPVGGARSARSRQSAIGELRAGPTLRSAVAPPPAEGPLIWTPPHAEMRAFDEAAPGYDEPDHTYGDAGHRFEDEAGYDGQDPARTEAGFGYEHAESGYEEAGFTYGDPGTGSYSEVDLRARVDAARAAMQAAPSLDPAPLDAAPHFSGAPHEAPTTRLWTDQLEAEQRTRQAAARHFE